MIKLWLIGLSKAKPLKNQSSNPQPSTLNPQPSTLKSQPSTLNQGS
jgi:hypothetical protein